MLFFIDTGAPHSCTRDNELKIIVRHSGRIIIQITDFKHDFKFVDKLVGSRGMVELILPTTGSTFYIPVALGDVDVEISALLGLYAPT